MKGDDLVFDSSKCRKCGSTLNDEARFCTKCGSPVLRDTENYCTNPECIRNKRGYSFEKSDVYCDICGKPTSLGTTAKQI